LGLLLAKKLLHGGGKKLLDWNVVLYLLKFIFWVLNSNWLIFNITFFSQVITTTITVVMAITEATADMVDTDTAGNFTLSYPQNF
jgi:hypothetical protein